MFVSVSVRRVTVVPFSLFADCSEKAEENKEKQPEEGETAVPFEEDGESLLPFIHF